MLWFKAVKKSSNRTLMRNMEICRKLQTAVCAVLNYILYSLDAATARSHQRRRPARLCRQICNWHTNWDKSVAQPDPSIHNNDNLFSTFCSSTGQQAQRAGQHPGLLPLLGQRQPQGGLYQERLLRRVRYRPFPDGASKSLRRPEARKRGWATQPGHPQVFTVPYVFCWHFEVDRHGWASRATLNFNCLLSKLPFLEKNMLFC